jgi:prepilin-type N-terminal cleavage/methylation domain-containing protein
MRLKGFTLIELLIVITIIGILSVSIVPRLTGGPAKARDAQRKADIQQIATAIEFFADDNGGLYPNPNPTTAPIGYSCIGSDALVPLDFYLSSIPKDPSAANAFTGASTCTGGYYYQSLNAGKGFMLVSSLETIQATGSGIYEKAFVIDPAMTASENFSLAANAALLCTDAVCTAAGKNPVYIYGR